MYENFYGFREKPFAVTPDPAFLYLGKKHGMGRTMLEYGLLNRAGITVLTGEIGAGKTTLIRSILDEIGDDVVVGLVTNTHASFGDLVGWIVAAFGIEPGDGGKTTVFNAFNEFLIAQYAAGKRTVLIVDEAQNLDGGMLEELRLLTNINADKDQLLQLVLVGQPELRERLRSPNLVQFVQRIGVDYHLGPLTADETSAYIEHRISVAGGPSGLFDTVACRFIHHQCDGVPRLINALCDTVLVYGFAEQRKSIPAELVYEVVRERLADGLFGAGIADLADPDPDLAIEQAAAMLRRARAEMAAESASDGISQVAGQTRKAL